jgi:hypothetical protein
MKINPAPSTLVNHSVPTITSRVDPEGARRIMEMLINLYSDQRLAVAREYVSNAVDATRAAGSTDAVVVTTPTRNEPNLIVTDRGIGMSFAELEAAFLAFAASTKRNSNDMVGGLGVGAKSAWTLTEAFLIDTVKDGKQTTVRAARNLEHQVLLSDAPSQEPNGTTVIIPVQVDNGPYGSNTESAWKTVIQEVARAHDPGAVKVDGRVVESIAAGPRIGPVLCCKPRNSWSDRFLIRSGGTLFDAGNDIANVIQRTTQLSACVVELPIGSFDHTPSRESVIATERTKQAVNTALSQFKRDFDALKQRISLLAGSDIAAAIKLRADSLGTVGNAQLLPIPYKLTAPAGSAWLHSSRNSSRASWTRSESDTDFEFDPLSMSTELSRTIVVSEVPRGKVLSQFARFLRDNHSSVNRIVTVPENQTALTLTVRIKSNNQATSQTMSISGKTSGIAAHYTFDNWQKSLASCRSSRGPIRGYEVAISRGNGTYYTDNLSAADIVALGLPVIYKEDSEYVSYHYKATAEPSVTVYLGNRKVAPLLRAIPTAMTPEEWRKQRADALTSNLSPAEVLAVVYNSSRCSDYRAAFNVAARAALTTSLVGLAGITNGYSQHAKHPKHALLTQVASLVDQAKRTTVKLDDSLTYTMPAEFEAIEKLHNKLVKAYPLLRHVKKDERHYVDYVIHTPPIGGA